MHFILFIAGVILVFDAIWWIASARLTSTNRWRWLVTAFMSAEVICLLWLFGGRLSGADLDRALPKFAVTSVFIWHTLLLPFFVVGVLVSLPVLVIKVCLRSFRRNSQSRSAAISPEKKSGLDRRQFLAVAAAAAPPLLTLSLSTIAMRQLQQFRIRRFTLPIRDLPPDLHGTTIAQVSDMHVGRFTSGRVSTGDGKNGQRATG